MSAVSTDTDTQKKRIHPHKFTLWVAMGSIIMMFAGLTSAYVVKRAQSKWIEFDLPVTFWIATVVILISSGTIHLALKAFKAREMARYRLLITITAVLGLLFAGLQLVGFLQVNHEVPMLYENSNPSSSFLGIIGGLHALHVLGGVVAILVIFFRAYSVKNKQYASTPVEIVATYWHFVDILWIYLFVFFNWIG
ncbi:cytochrome c oxidase subunit 3 [Filimonas lacunae]|nr:cytochrome c oxidase subunit 3 [Filimonas lacunae]